MPRAERNYRGAADRKASAAPYATKPARKGRVAKTKKKTQQKPTDVDAASNQIRLNDLKKRLRDLIRLMNHRNEAQSGERQHQKRELLALRRDLVDVLYRKARKEMISRYHMVRFFERRKAERILKQAQKQAAAAPPDAPDRESLKDRVHEAEVDLNYILYYPLERKYISLYDTKSKNGPSHGAGFKSELWNEVANAADQVELQSLRDRKDCLEPARRKAEEVVAKFTDSRNANSKAQQPTSFAQYGQSGHDDARGDAHDNTHGDTSDDDGAFFDED